MKNIHKTIIMTLTLLLLSVIGSIIVQITGQNSLTVNCSYVDPLTVDVLAFIVTLFLIFEGLYKIFKEPDLYFTKQITRSIRIAMGSAILAMHILQVMYK